MKRTCIAVCLAASLAVSLGAPSLFSQEEDIKAEALSPVAAVTGAKDWDGARTESEKAIDACQSYDDYEKLASEIKRALSRQREPRYSDILHYICAKNRVKELWRLNIYSMSEPMTLFFWTEDILPSGFLR